VKRLKIGISIDAVHRVGGTQRSTWEIAEHLGKEHDVVLLTKSSAATGAESFRCLVFDSFIYKIPYLGNILFALKVSRQKRHLKLDVLNVQGSNGLVQDVVTAQSVHKKWFLWSLKQTPFGSLHWWKKIFNPIHYVVILLETLQYKDHRYKKIIAISHQVKRDLIQYFSIPPSRIAVVHHGVNTTEFDPVRLGDLRLKQRRQLGFLEDDIVILFVAHEFKRKGLKVLIDALPSLGSRFRLLVVGKDDPTFFKAQAEQLGVSRRVVFSGPQAILAPWYACADLFVFPTSYEAFGMVITEAMAAGLPVIVPEDAGAAELIVDEEGGLLMKKWDDVAELVRLINRLEDDDLRHSMGRAARRSAEGRTWKNAADETLEVFRSLYPDSTFTL
jgi:UDP-glucose:(heptosyl)LPS alpha-1,3-glucosyltransferase